MILLKKIKKRIKALLTTKNPVSAYNILAPMYDGQQGNLLMELDEVVLGELLSATDLKGKIILDLGCGTGRHWNKLIELGAEKIIGVDSSEKMLEILVKKFPGSETHLLVGNKIDQVQDNSIDIVISTLTIGYIKDIETSFRELDRLLKKNGTLLITEYHPALLQMGGDRSFEHNKKIIVIKNFIHTLDKIRTITKQLNWQEIGFREKSIDETVRSYYEKHNALTAFEKYKGMPLIYGLHFKKI